MVGEDQEVLVLAAARGDAHYASRILVQAGLRVRVCATVQELAYLAADGCGCVFITQEALPTNPENPLLEVVRRQPPWSDLPIVVGLVSNARLTAGTQSIIATLGNVLLLERPLSAQAFVTAIQTGLRARARQYQVRELMRERDTLIGALERQVAEETAKLSAAIEHNRALSDPQKSASQVPDDSDRAR